MIADPWRGVYLPNAVFLAKIAFWQLQELLAS